MQIAGCWVHAKRGFATLVKVAGSEHAEGIIAAEASRRISNLFHLDKKWKDLSTLLFLSNGVIPMDNNLAEQAIRPFTLGRKNWVNIFSEQGAEASSVLYSIVETAKANQLRVFDYLEYTLDQLVKHADDTDRTFLQDLLPWSDYVQEHFHSPK